MKSCVGAKCCKNLLANLTNGYTNVEGMDDIFDAIVFNMFFTIVSL